MNKKIAIIIFLLLNAVATAGDGYRIRDIKIYYGARTSDVSISGSGKLEYSSFGMLNPTRLAIDIYKAEIPENLSSFEYLPPIRRISLQPVFDKNNSIRMIIEYEDEASYSFTESDSSLVISFLRTYEHKSIEKEILGKPAWLSKHINLFLEEGQVSAALNLISRRAGFNLVVSNLNEEPVWVNLNDVTVEDALDAILSASGNTYYISGQVVVVTKRSSEIHEGLVSRVYHLKYADATGFVEGIREILSQEAKIKILYPNSADGQGGGKSARFILITDTPEKHELVRDVISKIDVQPKQIAISVKFIETNISGEQSLGIDWNKMVESKLTGADPFGEDENETTTNEIYSAYSPWPPKEGSFVYGTLTVAELKAVLNFLHDSGRSRLLSDPSVTTSDGKEATISVTTTIPIQTINRFSEGAVVQDIVTYEYKEVGITLKVTPSINEKGRISLVCQPMVEEITGWVGPQTNQQPITTKRSVETEVVVTDGETVVIGGLYKEGKIENESKIWLLGDIPILGYLFKNKTINENKTDLMVFITPKITE